MQARIVTIPCLQSILIRDLQWSGAVCTVTNTHMVTHMVTHTRTHKHNKVCLFCFSREQRHFQAEIIFSPAEYLPRTLICVCVCVCARARQRESLCGNKILVLWDSLVPERCGKETMFPFWKVETRSSGLGWGSRKEAKNYFCSFFLMSKCSFGLSMWMVWMGASPLRTPGNK